MSEEQDAESWLLLPTDWDVLLVNTPEAFSLARWDCYD